MSGYRKRKSSDSLESDRKRISFERYDCGSYIKQESNYQVNNSGRPVGIQSAVVYKPQRYNNDQQYVEPYNSSESLSVINYNSDYDDFQCDLRCHMNYINSLRQCKPRYVNFNDLRRRLSAMDIRCYRIWNFSTALDLTLELESSFKYFINTRNELVFLSKLQRQQCIPFSYNEINIANRSGLHNRMNFLENETAYLSHRVNELFHQLQGVVIPSIIDDIRYMHSILYEKSWTDRARFWFSQFKQIKWENSSRVMNSHAHKYQQSTHQRSRRSYNIKEEFDVENSTKIKSEAVDIPNALPFDAKSVKVEKSDTGEPLLKSCLSKIRELCESLGSCKNDLKSEVVDMPPPFLIEAESVNVEKSDTDEPFLTNLLSRIRELSESIISCKNRLTASQAEPPDITVDKADLRAENESLDENDLSNSCVIIEPNVSVVTVSDDES